MTRRLANTYKQRDLSSNLLFSQMMLAPAVTSQQVVDLLGSRSYLNGDRELRDLEEILWKDIRQTQSVFSKLCNEDEIKSHPAYRSTIEKWTTLREDYLLDIDISLLSMFSEIYSVKIGNVLADVGYNILTPSSIKLYLDRYVAGQEETKKAIALTLYNHLLRNYIVQPSIVSNLLPVNNLCLIGPTGCGKTYLVKLIAELSGLPFATINASTLTSTGFHGENLETVITDLLIQSDDVEMAGRGIVFFDEFDKVNLKTSGEDMHIKGRGLQNELLSLIEHDEVTVPLNHGRAAGRVKVSTKNICFIFAGAFEGIKELKNGMNCCSGIGFYKNPNESSVTKFTTNDIVSYGIIPELAGRIARVSQLDKLSASNVFQILTKSNGNSLQQQLEYFKMHNIEIVINDEVLAHISEIIASKDFGARYINPVLNAIFEEYAFHAPELSGSTIYISIEEVIQKVSNLK